MQHLLSRRRLLASVAAVPILAATAQGETISGKLPWSPFAGEPPKPVNPLGWYFFHPGEAATVEAIVDRIDYIVGLGETVMSPLSVTEHTLRGVFDRLRHRTAQ